MAEAVRMYVHADTATPWPTLRQQAVRRAHELGDGRAARLLVTARDPRGGEDCVPGGMADTGRGSPCVGCQDPEVLALVRCQCEMGFCTQCLLQLMRSPGVPPACLTCCQQAAVTRGTVAMHDPDTADHALLTEFHNLPVNLASPDSADDVVPHTPMNCAACNSTSPMAEIWVDGGWRELPRGVRVDTLHTVAAAMGRPEEAAAMREALARPGMDVLEFSSAEARERVMQLLIRSHRHGAPQGIHYQRVVTGLASLVASEAVRGPRPQPPCVPERVHGGGARNIVSRDGPQDKPAGAIKFDREGPQ